MQAENRIDNTKRIAKNTLMLYVRMLFSMLVSLYTSRLILRTLGFEDYGIYNVVGGFVAMFSLVSGALSSSTSRFLTFELGRGDKKKLKQVFSTSVWIHIILAIIICLLMESVGVWFLNNRMTIPDDRIIAANWVFQSSVLAFMMNLLMVPYSASIISHERMSAFAYIGILDVLMKLAIVLFVSYSTFDYDKLIVYSLLLVFVSITLQSIYIYYCRKNFEECKTHLTFDKESWKEMSSFAGWNFIGSTAGLLRNQGVNVLLNIFGGPVLNAARGLSMTVNNAVGSFIGNFMVALNPQITKSYAAGDSEYAFTLVEKGARFSFYILLVMALPLLFESEFILTLWLSEYPGHTVSFVRLILLISLVDSMSHPLIVLQLATGKIRNYQLAVGGMVFMNFPISYLCLKLGAEPESVLVVGLVLSVACLLLRLFLLHKMILFPVLHFIKNVCLKVLIVLVIALPIPLIFRIEVQDGLFRFLLVSCLTVISTLFSVLYFGCIKSERIFIVDKIKGVKNKFIR